MGNPPPVYAYCGKWGIVRVSPTKEEKCRVTIVTNRSICIQSIKIKAVRCLQGKNSWVKPVLLAGIFLGEVSTLILPPLYLHKPSSFFGNKKL